MAGELDPTTLIRGSRFGEGPSKASELTEKVTKRGGGLLLVELRYSLFGSKKGVPTLNRIEEVRGRLPNVERNF